MSETLTSEEQQSKSSAPEEDLGVLAVSADMRDLPDEKYWELHCESMPQS